MTHSPFSEGLAGLEAKRILGGLNYYFGRRGQRFKGSGERLSLLLADIEAQGVDHALCTGDLTSMSFRAEFEAAALTGPVAGGDEAVIQGHRAALATEDPRLLRSYDALLDAARALAQPGRGGRSR